MQIKRIRVTLLLFLVIITVVGFAMKFYDGAGAHWFNDYGAGVMYVIFFIVLFSFVFPAKKHIFRIVIIVFLVTCSLETLQLWHPPFLQAIRQNFFGWALIGTHFVWWDFPHYVVGAALGWVLLKNVYKKMNKNQ
ncbi:MAG: DUF2809 domain-containing protein [Candidatus Electryonea clarkiae]|nr:DUF2809 domain-containing protein [Candidatus Electryonea clarkiae]MDP8286077.1 DUF2809 domain-containing protein [Candidatus Electryonea clarkiae]